MQRSDLLIFDLDGTICDPIEGIRGCINHALEAVGHPPVSSEVVAGFIGPPLNVAFESILQTTSKGLIDDLVRRYRERYAAAGFAECTVYPEVEEVLLYLASIGVPMAVCTSKRADLARGVLEHLGLARLFRFVEGGEIRQSKSEQLRRLHLAGKVPPTSIMIGDRRDDVEAGHACGISAGSVLWGYGTLPELEAAGPEYLFRRPSEWLALVDPAARG